jgi:4-amino-4-deoxy-L-arabinose transferase-like glycosyltransferase
MRAKEQAGKGWTPRLARPLIAAAVVRLALLALVLVRSGTSALNRPDTASYLEPGRNLLLHGEFVASGLPEISRTPGYPLFLALVSLAGPVAAALAQVLLSVFSVVLVWRLARTVFHDNRIALAAAWIFAFEPLSILYSILLLSETLFLALFLLSLERVAAFLREQRLSILAQAGVCLAAATFVRPVSYYLPVVLAVGLFAALARVPGLPPQRHGPVAGDPGLPPQRHGPVAGDPGLRWKAPAVLLLSTLPWLALWQIRNQVETGFGGFSSAQAYNLYFFSAAEVTGRVEHRSVVSVQNDFGYNDEQLFLARHPAAAGWNQAQRLEFMRAETNRVLRAHPGLFLRAQLAGAVRTAFNPSASIFISVLNSSLDDETYLRERSQGPLRAALWAARAHPGQTAVMAALEAVLLVLYFFAAKGTLRGGAPGVCLWLLLGVSLYFLGVSGVLGAARFRLPVMPVVCTLAAAGVLRRKEKIA